MMTMNTKMTLTIMLTIAMMMLTMSIMMLTRRIMMMMMAKDNVVYLPAFLVSATSCLHISVEESELHSSLLVFCSLCLLVTNLLSFSRSRE